MGALRAGGPAGGCGFAEFWLVTMKALKAGTGLDHEDAGIPEMSSGCEIYLGGGKVRFFGEGADIAQAGGLGISLDIAISRGRRGRGDPECQPDACLADFRAARRQRI